MQHDVKIFMCPQSRWQEYKSLRLEALKTVPEAFGSSYEQEINRPEEVWIQRAINTLVAELNGEVVGMCSYFVDTTYPKMKHIANFVSMYMKPQFRGLRIGEQLMVKQLELIKQNTEIVKIKLGVVSSQKAAKALYEKVGFEYVGVFKKELYVNGIFYDEHYMEMVL